ncbi:MAG: hypothetical protein Gyms2KO_28660 [Gymnodinialimonas sp.]
MLGNRNAPSVGENGAWGRGCFPVGTGIPNVSENRNPANAIALNTISGETHSLSGPAAKLVCWLAQAGPERPQLTGADLELAELLAADAIPLQFSPVDAKSRAHAWLDPTRIAEVQNGT